MGIEFQGVTLGNIAEGELEREFQEVLPEVIGAFAEPELYEHTSGAMSCTVPLSLTFTRHAETGVVTVGVRAAFKPPKRREIVRAAFLRDGVLLVEQAQQTELPMETNVTRLRASGDDEGGEA